MALTSAGFRSWALEQCFPTGELSLAQEVSEPRLSKYPFSVSTWDLRGVAQLYFRFGGDLVVSEKDRQVLIPMLDL